MASDALSIIPGAMLRNLADKLYEKRKNATLEIEGIVKQLAIGSFAWIAMTTWKVSERSGMVKEDAPKKRSASLSQANHRKGGLIGLAAVTVRLTSEAAQHLEIHHENYSLLWVCREHVPLRATPFGIPIQIVPPVLNSFLDQDSRVRYYACEALYNIAKVVREDFIIYFNKIFDALCKLFADSDANVQSAAHLLDRLVKVWPRLYLYIPR